MLEPSIFLFLSPTWHITFHQFLSDLIIYSFILLRNFSYINVSSILSWALPPLFLINFGNKRLTPFCPFSLYYNICKHINTTKYANRSPKGNKTVGSTFKACLGREKTESQSKTFSLKTWWTQWTNVIWKATVTHGWHKKIGVTLLPYFVKLLSLGEKTV
jgi:hypothetical protein